MESTHRVAFYQAFAAYATAQTQSIAVKVQRLPTVIARAVAGFVLLAVALISVVQWCIDSMATSAAAGNGS